MGRHETPTPSDARRTDDLRSLIRPDLLALLPDTSTPEFKAEARRQSRAPAESPSEADDQAFVDSISVFWEEE